jgi:hypothetical protein
MLNHMKRTLDSLRFDPRSKGDVVTSSNQASMIICRLVTFSVPGIREHTMIYGHLRWSATFDGDIRSDILRALII